MSRYKLSISLSLFFALYSGRASALEDSCSEVRQALAHGQLTQAERLLDPLLSQKPCNGEAWALKGRIMALNGGPQQAADYYGQALKCGGTLPRDNLLEIATAFSLLHRHREAVAILEAHLATRADDYEFAHEAGLSYLALDDLPKACTFLSRAYEGEPQNSAYAIDYGSCLLYRQELPKAVKFFTALTAKDPGQPEAWLFLGNARFLQGSFIIKIMNAMKYDAATIGNHEFDYGFGQLKKLSRKASFPYLCCNFKSLETGRAYFEAYKIFNAGGKKIAFVGIATPGSITSSNLGTNEI